MTRRRNHAPTVVGALALVLGLSLTACGEQDGTGSASEPTSSPSTSEPTSSTSSEPTETPSEPTGPACDEVWVAGSVLPQKYQGCEDAERGTFVEAMVYHCSSGQRLVTFRRNFYAAKGEVVNETETPLARNPEFKKVLASCGA